MPGLPEREIRPSFSFGQGIGWQPSDVAKAADDFCQKNRINPRQMAEARQLKCLNGST